MPLTIETRHMPPDIVVLAMSGRITMGNDCRQVEWTTKKLVTENRTKLIFDLSGITHVDSTGIGIIVTVAGQMKQAGGQLRVAGANAHIDQLLRVTNVDQIVPLHPTTDAAAAQF
ncbi:MAG TPA: STAS domain-containing protein [Verrucomicrobiae bacterium]|jgi:anti-sigma B factor antagonist|nr:STAS domain-containing protein [Verrucomicrobiae bacterium]